MTKLLSLLFLLSFFTKTQAQCDEKMEMVGELITNTSKNPQVELTDYSVLPQVGQKGDLTKSFENNIFGGKMTGWLGIAEAEVLSINKKIITYKVLAEKSEMTINGVKKNHFEKGNTVKFSWQMSSEPIPYTEKYENGTVKEKGQKVCGQLDGDCFSYFPSGLLKAKDHYTKGQLDGECIGYYENGKMHDKLYFKNGHKNGEITVYYENGNIKSSFTYVNGETQGVYKFYYEDGTLEESGIKANKIFKDVVNYRTDGSKKSVIAEVDAEGIKNGKYTLYDEKGNLEEQGAYKNDKIDGVITIYYTGGTVPKKEYTYKNKIIVAEKTWYPSGKIKYEFTFLNGTTEGNFVDYYENGNKKRIGTTTAGQDKSKEYYIGKMTTYHENGKLQEEATYENLLKNGVYLTFYPSGNPQITATMKDDKLNGDYTELYDSGKNKAVGVYNMGQITGNWTEWSEKGKKTKIKY